MWTVWNRLKMVNIECSDLFQSMHLHNQTETLAQIKRIFSNNNQLEWIKSLLFYNVSNKHNLFLVLDLSLEFYNHDLILIEILKKYPINDGMVMRHMSKATYSENFLSSLQFPFLFKQTYLSITKKDLNILISQKCDFLLSLLRNHSTDKNLIFKDFEICFSDSYQIPWIINNFIRIEKSHKIFSNDCLKLLKIARKHYPDSEDEIYWALVHNNSLFEKNVLSFILKGNYSQDVKDDIDVRLYLLDKDKKQPSFDVIDRVINKAIIHHAEPYNLLNLIYMKVQLGSTRIKKIIKHCKATNLKFSLNEIVVSDSADFPLIWEMLEYESQFSDSTIKKVVHHCKKMHPNEVYLIGTKIPEIYQYGAKASVIERAIDILDN